ncbi:S53 family peptidase [Trinickia caryophylli]|uniref:Sedolisin Serine peptidase. MEROPS family S53 n=2 Tax=Trinickia caryophylli TaxID=28094 RepID=A0A1X7CUV9_TRICW|nr:S53 family peptidase [Trinickia caryophylli]PMS13406.1 peptidase S53 [Trinickia caryophylli]TRX13735.1 S8/S53 family peptidase [Trinickia caryophylli]WQE15326.1 S53 family peptidase [Trinickia caryophylli]SMF03628.1 sedolisin Serine peptidase. MEROPS family S53 [Trinickia caryophylli]GLU30917.1 sedolisin [Trinickia caryophylli]
MKSRTIFKFKPQPPEKIRNSLLNRHKQVIFLFPLLATLAPAIAGATAAAATKWVATETKAFVPPPRAHALAAPQMEVASGEVMHIVVSMKIRDFGKLRDLANTVTRHGHPNYHRFLTPETFLERHAPTPRQIERVTAYLRQNGFVNITVSPNRLLVSADGTAGTVKAAFNTPLVHFQSNGRTVYANSAPAQVPEALGHSVLSVLGLQNVARARPLARIGPRTNASSTAVDIVMGHYPHEFPALYGASGLATASQTDIGIVTLGGTRQATADLKDFIQYNALPDVAVSTIPTGTANGDYSDDLETQLEWDLDSQSIVGAAGGRVKSLTFYAADLAAPGNTGLTQALNKVVTDNVAQVINVSLGWCEADAYADGTLAAEEQIFTTAAAQGQTFSVASGDEGVYECSNRGYPAGNRYSLSWPASSSYVIAVGGTTLHTHPDGSYARETVWNEGLDSDGKLWASTGGFSAFVPAPEWQRALGVSPTPTGRAVPDIAFDGAQSTGALILVAGNWFQVGGTSLSAPLFAGFWARLQSTHGNALGLPAPSIYRAAAADPRLVRDVTAGKNGYGGYGYRATKGWDYPTGWGSLDMARLAAYASRVPFAR